MLAAIDVAKSEGFKPEERENFFETVRREVGVGKINSMRACGAGSSRPQTDNVRNEDIDNLHLWNSLAALYENQGCYDDAAALYLACLEKQRTALGDIHPDNLGTMRQSHYMLPILKRRASF